MKDKMTIPAGMREAITDYMKTISMVDGVIDDLQELSAALLSIQHVLLAVLFDACDAGLINHETTCIDLTDELFK